MRRLHTSLPVLAWTVATGLAAVSLPGSVIALSGNEILLFTDVASTSGAAPNDCTDTDGRIKGFFTNINVVDLGNYGFHDAASGYVQSGDWWGYKGNGATGGSPLSLGSSYDCDLGATWNDTLDSVYHTQQ